ncbi:MAG: beta-ketoacyl-ACP synthase II [Myxococcales bacterium]
MGELTRRVVVTGIGLVSPLATGTAKTWEGLVAGKSGIKPITRFDAKDYDVQIAGEIRDFNAGDWVEKKEVRRLDPFISYAVAAGKMAMADSGLVVTDANAARLGCLVGSGIGGLTTVEATHKKVLEQGPSRISPFFVPEMIVNLAPGQISIKLGLKGPNWSPVSACATGAHAIGEAMRLIQRDEADAVIAGGTEAAITPLGVGGFAAARAMCTDSNDKPEKASRPFDKTRCGFVMAEGAGLVLVEELEHAKKRGARIYAELVGYAANSDAYHMTSPAPDGEGAARCMRLALQDAWMRPEEIGYINAHGTSTEANDLNETRAIKAVFKDHAKKLAVSSIKSMLGHQLGAAGSTEAAACALALLHNVLPPTINLDNPDPDCDLDYVPHQAREVKVDAVMTNSFGFGGTNAVLVLKRFVG